MKWKSILLGFVVLIMIVSLLSLTLGREILAGKQPGIESFTIIHFSGYLFFITLPVEALVPYYLSVGHSAVVLLMIALATAIIAQLIDYSIGFLVSDGIIHNIIGKWRYEKARKRVEEYGNWAILLFNLLPLSSPILILAAGMMRFPLRRVLLYSFIGLLVKYTAIVLIF